MTLNQKEFVVELAAEGRVMHGVAVEASLVLKPGGEDVISPFFLVGALTARGIELRLLDRSTSETCDAGLLIKQLDRDVGRP